MNLLFRLACLLTVGAMFHACTNDKSSTSTTQVQSTMRDSPMATTLPPSSAQGDTIKSPKVDGPFSKIVMGNTGAEAMLDQYLLAARKNDFVTMKKLCDGVSGDNPLCTNPGRFSGKLSRATIEGPVEVNNITAKVVLRLNSEEVQTLRLIQKGGKWLVSGFGPLTKTPSN